MATIIGFGSVSVTKVLKSGIQVDTYDNELHTVLCMIDNGSLGGGIVWGCKEHKQALQSVELKIFEIRKAIEEEEAGAELSGLLLDSHPATLANQERR